MQNGQLRAQRERRGWSQEDLVRALVALGIELGERQLGVSCSQISRWEHGVNEPRAPYRKLLCQLFNAPADELGLVPASPSASASITMEETTIEDGGTDVERRDFLHVAGVTAVTGLLAPGLLRRVGTAAPSPLMEGAVPLEAALSITDHYRVVLDSYPANNLMAPVLGHLQFVSQLLDSSTSRATQIQLATAASEAAGYVSRLALDLNDRDGGWRYHRLAVAYAERAENPVLQAYHLTDMSLRVGILHEGELAVQLVEHANTVVPKQASPGFQAWLAGRAAGAYSRVGDQLAALHALDRAEALADRAGEDEAPWPFTQLFGHGSLDGYRGAIAARLGLPQMALPALAAALKRPNPGRIDKYRALALGDLAMSHLPEGEVEEAVRLTAEAFDIASQLGSYRVLQRVREVRSCLNPYRDAAAVRDLDERMAGASGGHA